MFKPHHIALTVNNVEESSRWYHEKLGFQTLHHYKKQGMEIILLRLKEVLIELFSFEESTKPLPNYRQTLMEDLHTVGTKHLCIEVENLDKVVKDLKSKGVEFVMETDDAGFGGRYIFFKDCNGILVELYQN
ncbi:MAG: VOC family protein [bacterium]|nr:VOC family protein [bacterium]